MAKITPFVAPILQGKSEQFKQYIDQLNGQRKQEYVDLLNKIGVERERNFLQKTPNGDFVIVVWDAADPEKSVKEFSQSTDESTKWNLQQIKEINGIDLAQVANEPLPQLVVDSGSTSEPVSVNAKLKAFAIPIPQGKEDQSAQFTDQLAGSRKQGFNDSRMKRNVHERSFLQHSPQGSVIIVTHEGVSAENFLKEFTQSNDEFTQWFIQQVQDIYGANLVELAQAPAPELVYDSKQAVREPALAS